MLSVPRRLGVTRRRCRNAEIESIGSRRRALFLLQRPAFYVKGLQTFRSRARGRQGCVRERKCSRHVINRNRAGVELTSRGDACL